MHEVILQKLKRLIGIDSTIDVFDAALIMHANSVMLTIEQLGIKLNRYILTSEDSWEDLTDDNTLAERLNTYLYLKVRLLFDPPSTSFVIDAIQKQIAELEWRFNVEYEGR